MSEGTLVNVAVGKVHIEEANPKMPFSFSTIYLYSVVCGGRIMKTSTHIKKKTNGAMIIRRKQV